MTKLKNTFKTDTLFKMLFVKHPDLLKDLVAELLRIGIDSIGRFEITNPEMPPESLGDKFCRLDINMTVDGQRIDLEIQVQDEGDYPERVLYHWAREYSTALAEGEDYSQLPRTIIISIINFKLFACVEYHSEFCALEVSRHTMLTDKMSLQFYELPKIPLEISAADHRLLWLSLFRADTEEEFSQISALGVPIMNKAIDAFNSITASSEFREMERLRSKARHDEAQALRYARIEGMQKGMQKGKIEGRKEGKIEGKIEGAIEKAYAVAKNLLLINLPLESIVTATGLSQDEVEKLRDIS